MDNFRKQYNFLGRRSQDSRPTICQLPSPEILKTSYCLKSPLLALFSYLLPHQTLGNLVFLLKAQVLSLCSISFGLFFSSSLTFFLFIFYFFNFKFDYFVLDKNKVISTVMRTLWASICWPSSGTKVTSAMSSSVGLSCWVELCLSFYEQIMLLSIISIWRRKKLWCL